MSRRSHYDSASLAIGERSWAHGDFSWIESTFHQGIKGCATTLLGHRFNDVTETHEGETPPTGLKLALIGIVIKRFRLLALTSTSSLVGAKVNDFA